MYGTFPCVMEEEPPVTRFNKAVQSWNKTYRLVYTYLDKHRPKEAELFKMRMDPIFVLANKRSWVEMAWAEYWQLREWLLNVYTAWQLPENINAYQWSFVHDLSEMIKSQGGDKGIVI